MVYDDLPTFPTILLSYSVFRRKGELFLLILRFVQVQGCVMTSPGSDS